MIELKLFAGELARTLCSVSTMNEDTHTLAVGELREIGFTPNAILDVDSGITAAIIVCHAMAVRGGWWHDVRTGEPLKRNDGEMIALMHSELSEMLEGVRKGKRDDHLTHRSAEEVEAADLLIRLFDYAGAKRLDIAGAMLEKLAYNARRADHKPEARAAAGGKSF